MAVFHGVIRSQLMAMDTGLSVILPYDRPADDQSVPCKTLYLLHGLGENHQAWCRYTCIERYARAKGIAVIMPEVQRSFYQDMAMGLPYFSYVTQELPQLCAQLFHISSSREDTFVAGLSMGGYGALKCGLTYPDRYAGCASFSGAVDLNRVLDKTLDPHLIAQTYAVFGSDVDKLQQTDDLCWLSTQVGNLPQSQHPQVMLTCGKQDFLYQDNLDFVAHLKNTPLQFQYHEWDGDHTWGFWDKSVEMALDLFFPSQTAG